MTAALMPVEHSPSIFFQDLAGTMAPCYIDNRGHATEAYP
jgi:hypothetical protein